MDCTSDIVKNLNQSLNIDEENLIFRSNFGTILGEIFQNLISGGDDYSGPESTSEKILKI